MHREDPRRGRPRRRRNRPRTCGTPNGSCCPGRRPSGRTRTSARCRHRVPQATTGSSTRWSWSRGCARSAPWSASPGWPHPSATTSSRSSGYRSAAAATEWVPAVEQRGEGIFLQLREEHGRRAGPRRVAEHEHIAGAAGAPTGSGRYDRAQTPQAGFPDRPAHAHPHAQPHADPPGRAGVRILLSELRERIYLGTPPRPPPAC